MLASQDVSLTSDNSYISNSSAALIQSGGDALLAAGGGSVTNYAAIISGGSVDIEAQTSFVNNVDGVIDANNNIIATANVNHINNYGTLDAGQDVWLTSNESYITNQEAGAIISGRSAFIDARGGAVTNDSAITSDGYINIAAQTSFTNSELGLINAGKDLFATANLNRISMMECLMRRVMCG